MDEILYKACGRLNNNSDDHILTKMDEIKEQINRALKSSD